MEYVALGSTNLLVSRTAFGAMSLDCKEIEACGDKAEETACAIVRQAYDAGINFFDTAHSSFVCERRLGAALHGIRQNVLLATDAGNVDELKFDLSESLSALETDFIDLYQIENPSFLPVIGGKDGLYDELLSLKKRGIIHHFGIATENLDIAKEAIESGLYETVQFSFNILTSDVSVALVRLCRERDVGCIAMQPLNGGLLRNIPLAVGYFSQFENVVPVWGAHTKEELSHILYFIEHPPVIDEQFKADVQKLRDFFN